MSRYSQLYIERGKRDVDSKRARIRLQAHFYEVSCDRSAVAAEILKTLGCKVTPGSHGYRFDQFFQEAPLRDVLDGITLIYSITYAQRHYAPNEPGKWIAAVSRIFKEEHLAYKVDKNGIVHPFIDIEFETNRISTVEALSTTRFAEACASFDAAFHHLRDGKGREAIRMMFPAVETAAKVLFPGKFATLGPSELTRFLRPRTQSKYAGNQPAIDAAGRLLASFGEWINAAQQYRHGQAQESVADPPMDFVVAHLSTGASYLRWMIEICE